LPATITADIIRSLRSPILILIDAASHPDCRATIHMSDIPSFSYYLLWEERQLVSVANLTRQDGLDFLRLVPEIDVVTKVTRYPLPKANEALADLRAGRFEGAAVLIP
jgi:propanol-preferring alcohol dehydrogenase